MKTMRKYKTYNSDIVSDYVIIGTGNIALRHANNISSLKKNKIVTICKRSKSKSNQNFKAFCNNFTNNINLIKPKTAASIAVIASPASLHIKDSIILAKQGFHLFIEKPLSITMEKVKQLTSICKKKKLRTLVGYNLRFLDNMNSLKKIIKSKKCGKIYHVHIYVGSNYKFWRGKNHSSSVTVNKNLGGGVINELSHEIDYMIYLFGQPDNVLTYHCKENKSSNVEEMIVSVFKYKKLNMYITMHLNMLSNNVARYCLIESSNMSIKFDLIKNKLSLSDKSLGNKLEKKVTTIDQTYKNELLHLDKCIRNKKETLSSLNNSILTMKAILAVKKSLQKKSLVKVS